MGPALKARFPSASAQGLSLSNGNAPFRRQSHREWCRNESSRACGAGGLALHESLGRCELPMNAAPLALNEYSGRVESWRVESTNVAESQHRTLLIPIRDIRVIRG